MIKGFLLSVILLFVFDCMGQQGPLLIKNQKCFGGVGDEYAGMGYANMDQKNLIKDSKGGFIISGNSSSCNSGNITGCGGFTVPDGWVANLDSNLNILWQFRFPLDTLQTVNTILPAIDGGYIIFGSSFNGCYGLGEVKIIKIDDKGNRKWARCYGGSNGEDAGSIVQADSTGYIFVASTFSNNGDVKGFHASTSADAADLWLVKIDLSGNIVWQKCYGSKFNEGGKTIKAAGDGNFIVGGYATKDEDDVAGGAHYKALTTDIWILKVSPLGNILWQKCLGGSSPEAIGDIEVIQDGIMVVGSTESTDGDVTGWHSGCSYCEDAWAVRLDNNGQIVWQKVFGGSNFDMFCDIIKDDEGNFMATGTTLSSDGDVSEYRGLYGDVWLVNFSPAGQLNWEKTYGGSGNEGASTIIKGYGNDYFISGATNSKDQDVKGNHGNFDVWLIQLGNQNSIVGKAFYDVNKNGKKESNELDFDLTKIESSKNNQVISSIPYRGQYRINVDTGTYTTRIAGYNEYFVAVPLSETSTFSSFFNTDTIDFALQPIDGRRDLQINLIPTSGVRAGFRTSYELKYQNVGTVSSTGRVKLVRDHRLILALSSVPASTLSGDTLVWNFTDLSPLATRSISLSFQIPPPPSVNINDTLQWFAWVEQDGQDLTPLNDTSILRQPVTGAFDPNNKLENSGGSFSSQRAIRGDYLNYTINFQNIGNDTAFTVIVRDTLDSKLDWNSFEMVGSSHAYHIQIKDRNKLTWTFTDIKLVDSKTNEPGSHGYISFRIKPISNIALQDVINNRASIYFDFNPPVVTNTAVTVISELKQAPVLPTPAFNLPGKVCESATRIFGKISNPPSGPVAMEIKYNSLLLPYNVTDSSFLIPTNAVGVNSIEVQYISGNVIKSTVSTYRVEAKPSAPIITSSGSLSFCEGGTATLSSSAELNNEWFKDGQNITAAKNKSYTVDATGIYTVRYTDINGCQSPLSAEATVIKFATAAAPIINATGATMFCAGANVTLRSSTASQYQWYKDGQVIPSAIEQSYIATIAGEYSAKIIDNNGCVSQKSNAINVTITQLAQGPRPIQTDSVLTAPLNADAYQWYMDGAPVAGATSQAITINKSANYHYTYSINGCKSEPSQDINATLLPNNTAPSGNYLTIGPNPTTGTIYLRSLSLSDQYTVVVRDELGRSLKTLRFSGLNNFSFSLSGLPYGLYLLELHNHTRKFVLSKKIVFVN